MRKAVLYARTAAHPSADDLFKEIIPPDHVD